MTLSDLPMDAVPIVTVFDVPKTLVLASVAVRITQIRTDTVPGVPVPGMRLELHIFVYCRCNYRVVCIQVSFDVRLFAHVFSVVSVFGATSAM